MASAYYDLKHSVAASALVQAQSLPRELVRSRSGVQIPAPFPVREESKSDEIETDATFDDNDFGYCECWPDLQVPLLQTRSTTPAVTYYPCVIHAVHQTDQPYAEYATGVTYSHQTALRDHGPAIGNAIRLTHDAGVNPGPVVCTLSAHCEPYQYPIELSVEFYVAGAWVNFLTFDSPVWPMTWDQRSAVVVGVPEFIRTVLTVPPGLFLQRRRLKLDISFSRSLTAPLHTDRFGFFTPGIVAWDVCANASWPYLPQLPDIDRVRNLGYEALLTYTGSRQLDGGKIAGALVPFDWSPLSDNPFNAVASVRHNKYSAALRSGAHGTWRLAALSELDPLAPEDRPFPQMKLVFGYQRNNAENQSLRIRATGLFGVYSDSPVIGLAPFVEPLRPSDLELVMEYFQSAPAVTENATHEKLKSAAKFIGRAISGAASIAGKSASMLASHPEIASALAVAAGQPEIAAAIETYAVARKRRTVQANQSEVLPMQRVPRNPTKPKNKNQKGKQAK